MNAIATFKWLASAMRNRHIKSAQQIVWPATHAANHTLYQLKTYEKSIGAKVHNLYQTCYHRDTKLV